MPATVEELEQAADIFQREAAEVLRLNNGVRAGLNPDVLSGGRLGASLEEFVVSAGQQTVAISDELLDLAVRASVAATILLLPGAPSAPPPGPGGPPAGPGGPPGGPPGA